MRALRRLLVVLVVVAVAYLAVVNVVLNTGLGPSLVNRKPEKFTLHWTHGVTWWPGRVTLWGVEARGHVRHVRWQAHARRASGQIALGALLRRELHVPDLVADDVHGEVTRVDTDMPPPPSEPGGWTLRFDRIATTSLSAARIVGVDLAMHGEATFGFVKQLRGGPLEILPSHVLLRDLEARHDGTAWLQRGELESDFSLPSHRREDAPGLQRLTLADVTLRLAGAVPALAVDLDAQGHLDGVVVAGSGDHGTLDAKLALRGGELADGGVLDLRVPLAATRGQARSDAEAMAHVAVVSDAIRVTVDLPPPPEGKGSVRADLSLSGRALPIAADAAEVLARTHGEVALDWHFDSLEWLGPLLVRTPWLALQGAGQLEAQLRVEHGRLVAGSRAAVPAVELVATVAEHRFHGSARAEGRLDDKGDLVLGLGLAAFEAAAGDAPDKALLRGKDLRIDATARADQGFRDSLQAHMRFSGAEVPDLRAINAYLPRKAFAILAGSARLDGDLQLDAGGRISGGRVGIAARGARASFAAIELGGDFDLDARLGGTDLAARHFDLGGTTLKMRGLRIAGDERTAGQRWWANVALPRGRVEGFRPLQVDADARLELENLGLLLALYARHRDYPRWAMKLADAGVLRADGTMRMRGDALVLDRVEAANDRFALKARLRVADRQPSGDLLLTWGVLGMGLELRGEAHDVHWVGARKWYEARPDLIARGR